MSSKTELESKHLSDLHALAAEAGVEKFRLLTRTELVEKLSDGDGTGSDGGSSGGRSRGGGSRQGGSRESSREGSREGSRPPRQRERPERRRRRAGGNDGSPQGDDLGREAVGGGSELTAGAASDPSAPGAAESAPRAPSSRTSREAAAPVGDSAASESTESGRPKRRRRRRRFGRRGKEGVTIQDLLLPPEAGRQAIVAAESRAACTALLRGIAADIAQDSKGPDPVVLLIDPTPEELADWKREAPQAEIVAAGQARHANDALAQASNRAGSGDDVILLVDSLTRLATDFGDSDTAKEFFDAGRAAAATGGGSLTVVVALERS